MSNEQGAMSNGKKTARLCLRHDSLANFHAEGAKAQSTQREEGKKGRMEEGNGRFFMSNVRFLQANGRFLKPSVRNISAKVRFLKPKVRNILASVRFLEPSVRNFSADVCNILANIGNIFIEFGVKMGKI